jgi:hypothetical protein
MPGDHPEPIGYRAFVAHATDFANQPLHIDSVTFGTEAEARAWVEQGRAIAPDPGNFACSVVPVFGAPL